MLLEIPLAELEPHVIMLYERDMKEEQMNRLNVGNFTLNSSFCRINTVRVGLWC